MWGWQLALHCVFRWRLGRAARFTACSIPFSRKMQNWKNAPPVHTKGRKSVFGPFPCHWIWQCWHTGHGTVSKQAEEVFELQPGCFVLRVLATAFWGFVL